LAPIGTPTEVPYPQDATLSTDGRFLYISADLNNGFGTRDLYGFLVDDSGGITPMSGSPFDSSPGLYSFAIDPKGRFLYTTDLANSSIIGFNIDPTSGTLRQFSGAGFPTGKYAGLMALDATGSLLFKTNIIDNNLWIYSVDSTTGFLSPLPNSPLPAGSFPWGIAFDPSNTFVYVANSKDATYSVYAIEANGCGVAQVPGSPFLTPFSPNFITMTR
jgi:6-phosphogluconolactonase